MRLCMMPVRITDLVNKIKMNTIYFILKFKSFCSYRNRTILQIYYEGMDILYQNPLTIYNLNPSIVNISSIFNDY
jgi:hypothetical protein